MIRTNRHFVALIRMSADGCVNHIAVSIQPSRSDREVLFLNKTVVELLSQVHVDGIGFCNHDDSAGVAIKSMHNARTSGASNVRK